MANGLVLRRLLDSQGLDGGGLLTHEEAQPLEIGLMIHLLRNEPHRVRVGVGLHVGLGPRTYRLSRDRARAQARAARAVRSS